MRCIIFAMKFYSRLSVDVSFSLSFCVRIFVCVLANISVSSTDYIVVEIFPYKYITENKNKK